MRVRISEGLTPSERWLVRLCQRTFLRLWSYPNLYKKPGQELCDLLVVSGTDVVIFSVKSKEYGDPSDPNNWRRWLRRVVIGAAKQLHGARRWIEQFPSRVFIDAACRTQFPLLACAEAPWTIHLVVVALGAVDSCRVLNGSAEGLLLDTALKPNDCIGEECQPFVVGDLTSNHGFVHVLDEFSCDLLLKELDTITDFLAYLRAKEDLVRAHEVRGRECDLLAAYVIHGLVEAEQGFGVPADLSAAEPRPGLWAEFSTGERLATKKEADKISYFWDMVIDHFSMHVLDGTLITSDDPWSLELALRAMATERRFQRRALARGLLEKLQEPVTKDFSTRFAANPPELPRFGYSFMIHCDSTAMDDESRAKLLAGYCMTLRTRIPSLEATVGIGFDSRTKAPRDLVHVSFENWTPEDQAQFERVRKGFGLAEAGELILRAQTEYEYPSESD